ncbi:hypothetical protein [Saezia sanguinis]|uniref:hypothetical protein n=1 Tax=Saezia sanguinis TaxID=1965230 RepID=UPI0013A62C81|nr:hypothetical protein [Saezia sanguinis]
MNKGVYHNLLPVYVQDMLKRAATMYPDSEIRRSIAVEDAIARARRTCPQCFEQAACSDARHCPPVPEGGMQAGGVQGRVVPVVAHTDGGTACCGGGGSSGCSGHCGDGCGSGCNSDCNNVCSGECARKGV